MKFYFAFLILVSALKLNAQNKKILMFISHENTYYSEYIVAKKALEGAGYFVDVRSASTLPASTYMTPMNTTISETSNSLSGSSHADFTSQFQTNFSTTWDENLNITPSFIETNGSLLDVQNISDYKALVIAGGTGILDYRINGTYSSQGINDRLLSASVIEAVANKLSQLGKEGLLLGIPVLAQCHGASIPVFWRIDGTSGPGAEAQGISILKYSNVAGYPDGQTSADYLSLGVNHNSSKSVSICSPTGQFLNDGRPNERIILSRDWYPQTVSYATKTLLNVIETYPPLNKLTSQKSILILHGGAIDPTNCSASNRLNDIPCNYGAGPNLPADFTDIQNLLNQSVSPVNYNFTVNELNITSSTLPFDNSNALEILTFLGQYDAIVFYKHWSTGMTDAIQEALTEYVDNGGGLLNLHHGLYNDIDGSLSKNNLINNLFNCSSEMNTWSANLTNYNLLNTNYGHFITSYHVNYTENLSAPNSWDTELNLNSSNLSYSSLPTMPIYDEIYNNMQFTTNASFGNSINQISPLLSNDLDPSGQQHTSGFCKLVDINNDNLIGKLVYFQVGERKENLNSNSPFSRMIQNAILWCSYPHEQQSNNLSLSENTNFVSIFPNPFTDELTINNTSSDELISLDLYSAMGEKIKSMPLNNSSESIQLKELKLSAGIYFVQIISSNHKSTFKICKY